MAIPNWQPPEKKIPSETYLGERDKAVLHERVGSALNEWEILESTLAEIFRLMVESKSMAAFRAYGMIIAGRKDVLDVAAVEFFRGNADPTMADFYELFNAYGTAAQYRNNIAHGICYTRLYAGGGPTVSTGWFLYPPHYNSRKRKYGPKDEAAIYIYNAADISHCEERFKTLTAFANGLEKYLRGTYSLS